MTAYIERINIPLTSPLIITALLFSTAACSNPSAVSTSNNKSTATESKEVSASDSDTQTATQTTTQTKTSKPDFTTKAIATFDEPWAMTALPIADSTAPKLLLTQKTGELFIVDTATGNKTKIEGVPTSLTVVKAA